MKSTAFSNNRFLNRGTVRHIIPIFAFVMLSLIGVTSSAYALIAQNISGSGTVYISHGGTNGTYTYDLGVYSSSFLPVTFTIFSDPNDTISAISDGGIVSLTGNAGRADILLDQPGDANYDPAPQKTLTINVGGIPQIISFPQPTDMVFDPSTSFPIVQILEATASSKLPVTFEIIKGDTVVTLYDAPGETKPNINETVRPNLGAGTVTIRATQAGGGKYEAAEPFERTFTVLPGQQYIRFDTPVHDITFGDEPIIILARAYYRIYYKLADGNIAYNEFEVPNTYIRYAVTDGPANIIKRSDGQYAVVTTGMGRVQIMAYVDDPTDLNNDGISDSIDIDKDGVIEMFLGNNPYNNDGTDDFAATYTLDSYISRTISRTTGASNTTGDQGALFLDRWNWENPIPSVDTYYNDVIYARDSYVAVGDTGRVAFRDTTNDNGWVVISPTTTNIPVGISLSGIAYDGVNYVASGSDGKIYTTPNLNTSWIANQVTSTDVEITSITYANNTFIATTSDGKMLHSPDGLGGNWFGDATSISNVSNTLKLNSVTYGTSSIWVAAGDQGTILKSTDNGTSWVTQVTGTVRNLNEVYYDSKNGLYIAVGDEGIILTSGNGSNWSVRNTSGKENLNTVAYGNGFYVAVGNGGMVMTSHDGSLWTQRSTRFPNNLQSIVFANGMFIAVADNFSVFMSPTGENWTLKASNTSHTLYNVTHGDSAFIAVGDGGTILRKDDSSTTWTNRRTSLPVAVQDADFHGIAFGVVDDSNHVFVAVGTNKKVIISKDDGITWTEALVPPLIDTTYNDVIFGKDDQGNGLFVAVGDNFTVAISADGDNWDIISDLPTGTVTNLHGITYAEDIQTFVAVGDGGTVLLSEDGFNWYYRYSGANVNLNDISYGKELRKFVAVGDEGAILTSDFGDVWFWQSSGTSYAIHGIDYLANTPDTVGTPAIGGTFVAVGENFQVLSSSDSLNWNVQISSNINTLHGIGHGNGQFIAVGDFQSIISAVIAIPSGLDNWIQNNPLPSGINLQSIIYQNNLYIAVGDGGTILTSSNGFNWIKQTTGTTDVIKDIAYGNQRFVAIGASAILGSSDGTNWSVEQTWTGDMNSVTYGDGEFVIVGNSGLILRSNNGINWTPAFTAGTKAFGQVEDGTVPDLNDVAYGDGRFVAVGSPTTVTLYCPATLGLIKFDMSTVVVSTDGGNSWDLMYPDIRGLNDDGCPIYIQSTLRGISYGNGVFMTVGTQFAVMTWNPSQSNLIPYVHRGDDVSYQSDWVVNSLGAGQLNKVAFGTGNGVPRFTVVGDGGILFTTTNGSDHEYHFTGITDNLNNVVFGLETFLAVGDKGNILSSADGTSWISQRSSDFLYTINGFAYNGELITAVANSGQIVTSPDGKSWTKQSSGTTLDINAVTYGKGKFVAVTKNGSTVTSTNGTFWTPTYSGVNSDLYDIVYHEDDLGDTLFQEFVTVGAGGRIATSSDGINWTTHRAPLPNDLFAIAYADSIHQFVAVGAKGTIFYSSDAADWATATIDSPNYTTDILDVAFGNGTFVAVGRFGRVLTSDDGISWKYLENVTSTDFRLDSIYFGDGVFVVTGQEGIILTSVNGTKWLSRPSTTRSSLVSGAYLSGLYLAGGDFGTVVSANQLIVQQEQAIFFPEIKPDLVSGDLKGYELRALASSGLDVVYSIITGDNLVTIEKGGVVYANKDTTGDVTIRASQSGNAFFKAAPPIDRSFKVVLANNTIDWGGGISDAVFGDSPITLTATSSINPDPTIVYKVISGPGEISGDKLKITGAGIITIEASSLGNDTISPAHAQTTLKVSKAPQTIDFQKIEEKSYGDPAFLPIATATSGLPVTFTVVDSAYINSSGMIVITGQGAFTVTATQGGDDNYLPATNAPETTNPQIVSVAAAQPGSLWASAKSIPSFSTITNYLGVEYVNDQYIAMGTSSRIVSSGDGASWSAHTSGSNSYVDVAYGNGVYVAVGALGSILTSDDGESWMIRNSGIITNFTAITYAAGKFMAVGQGGIIASSTDGEEWTTQSSSVVSALNDIVYGDGTYVIVGDNGVILYSTDGVSWARFTHQLVDNLSSVAYGNGIFVAVGDTSTIWTSSNGEQWSLKSTTISNLNAITYGGDRFIAVGDNGAIVTSTDTITWVPRVSGVSTNLNGISYIYGQFVAVGDSDTIIVSGKYNEDGYSEQVIPAIDIPDLTIGDQQTLGPIYTQDKNTQQDVLPVEFYVQKGPGVITTGTNGEYLLTVTGATANNPLYVVASQAGNSQYKAAKTVILPITVDKGDLTLTVNPLPPLSFSYGQPDLKIIENAAADYTPGANEVAIYATQKNTSTLVPSTFTYSVDAGKGVGFVTKVENGVTNKYIRILNESATAATITVNIAATDNYNALTTNNTFTISVSGNFPDGQLVTPVEGDRFTASTPVYLEASAIDTGTGAGIKSVDFYANDALVATGIEVSDDSNNNRWNASWIPGISGNYVLYLKITDTDDNITQTSNVNVVALPPIGNVPTSVILSGPDTGYVGRVSTFFATVTDPDGDVTNVTFYVNGVAASSDTSPPFSFDFTPNQSGTSTVVAKATDRNNNTRTSGPLKFTVDEPTAFTVELSTSLSDPVPPETELKAPLGTDVIITGTPSELANPIQTMVFYADGLLLGTDSTSPYTAIWTTTSPGTHYIRVVATDIYNTVAIKEIPIFVDKTIVGSAPFLNINSITANGNITENSEVIVTATTAVGATLEFNLNGTPVDAANYITNNSIRIIPVAQSDTKTDPNYRKYELRVVARKGGFTRVIVLNQNYVANLFYNRPTIVMDSPKANDEIIADVPYTLRAKVSGSGSTDVASVIFYANGEEIGVATAAPYQLDWTPTIPTGSTTQSYILTAAVLRNSIAWDANPDNIEVLNVDVSPVALSQNITVTAVIDDSVEVQGPVFDSATPLTPVKYDATINNTILAGRTITVAANVTDPDGYIASVQFFVGSTPIGPPDTTEPFEIQWTPLSSGNYQLSAEAIDNDGNITTYPVKPTPQASLHTIKVVSNAAPTVTLDYPPVSANYSIGSTIELIATATDADGSIAKVEFFSDKSTTAIGESSAKPYRIIWTPESAGTYKIRARATDDLGRTTDSASTTVTIEPSKSGAVPMVSVVTPATGINLTANSTILLEAAVSDADSTPTTSDIAEVIFYANGQPVKLKNNDTSVTAAPFTKLWSPGKVGVFRIVASARDIAGNIVLSAPVDFNVTSADGLAPTISSISLNPNNLVIGNSTYITVNATDDLRVTRVDYFVDGVKLGEDSRSPFSLKWTPALAGTYRIHAVAYDTSLNFTTSNYLTVTVADLSDEFNLTITARADIILGSDVIIEASSTSNTRLVDRVSFYADNKLIGVDDSAPYTVVWTPASEGNHVIRVEAIDSNENDATPATQSILVKPKIANNQAPRLFVNVTANGDITDNSSVLISATVYDDDEVPPTLVFYVNGIETPQSPNGSYIIVQPTPLSTISGQNNYRLYEIRVVATDSVGNSRATVLSNVHIAPINVNRPTVTLSTSAANNAFLAGTPVILSAGLSGSGVSDVQKVIYYVNGIEVGTATAAPFSFEWVPTLDGVTSTDVTLTCATLSTPVSYDYYSGLPAVDSYPVSFAPEISGAIQAQEVGPDPIVSVTSPEEGTRYSIGSTITLHASATVGSGRTISSVEYYQVTLEGTTYKLSKPLGSSTEFPYEKTYKVTAPGEFYIAAVATSNTGGVGVSDIRTISIEAGSIPQITSFTSDAINNTVFKGSPITFTVVATSEDGISNVELGQRFSNGLEDIVTSDNTSPYVMTVVPDVEGTYTFFATAISSKDVTNKSNTITIQVKQPQPYNTDAVYNADFIFQNYLDLLFRSPTEAELSDYSTKLGNATQGYTRPQLIRELMLTDEYLPIQTALSINYMFAGIWPDRPTLSNDVALVQSFGYDALVNQYLTKLQGTYGAALPDTQSPEADIYKFLNKLWEIKYGVKTMTDNQYKDMSFYFKNLGLVPFLSRYIRDIGNKPVGNDVYTPNFVIKNPPNDRFYDWVTSASLITNLLNEAPNQADVLTLSTYPIIDRIGLIIYGDSGPFAGRYKARFSSIDAGATLYSNGWRHSAWLGWYYEGFKPWLYHAQHGWVFPFSSNSKDVWLWSVDMGWLWTGSQFYPYLYSAQENSWLYYEMDTSNPRVFWTTAGVREER